MKSKSFAINLKSPYYSTLVKLGQSPNLSLLEGDFKIDSVLYSIVNSLQDFQTSCKTVIYLIQNDKDVDYQIILFQIVNPNVKLIPCLSTGLEIFVKQLLQDTSQDLNIDQKNVFTIIDQKNVFTIIEDLGLSEHGMETVLF